jgi:transportin-1
MTSGKVELIEPSVLILGILSDEGCALGSITPHLPNMIPFLMQLVENQYSILRSTTLWTLSQFTDFISENEEISESYFRLACQRMTDEDPNV